MSLVNGIIQTPNGYAVKNFMEPKKAPIDIGNISFPNYEAAVYYMSNLLYPESYRNYLLAVKDLVPDYDTWNNLIFIGHAQGFYDHEQKRFKSARQMDMHAADDVEIAYVEALEATYESILAMVEKK